MANVSLTQTQLDSIITAINNRQKTGVSYTKTEEVALLASLVTTPAVLTALVP